MPYGTTCMHEFVMSGGRQKRANGVRTLDMAKRLLDYGFHPPTVYFPLLVDEAMMIEPTETEPVQALDAFADVDARRSPRRRRPIPNWSRVHRTRRRSAGLDEAGAARNPDLRWTPPGQ